MNRRTLGGPLLAFASAAVMLGLIAGLVALLVSGNSLSGDDDSTMGEYGRIGPVPTIEGRPLADSYPFTRYFRLPDGTRDAGVTTNTPRNNWFGQFVLPEPTSAALGELRRQAEASGLMTASIRDSEGGFTFSGQELEGSVALFRITPEVHVLVITLTRYQ